MWFFCVSANRKATWQVLQVYWCAEVSGLPAVPFAGLLEAMVAILGEEEHTADDNGLLGGPGPTGKKHDASSWSAAVTA